MSNQTLEQASGSPATQRLLLVAGVILGILFIIIGVVYVTTPAGSLPSFFPGFKLASTTIHYKHALLAFVLGLGSFALAWFSMGPAKKQAGSAK